MTHRTDTHKYGKTQLHHEQSKIRWKIYVKSIGLPKKQASNKITTVIVARRFAG